MAQLFRFHLSCIPWKKHIINSDGIRDPALEKWDWIPGTILEMCATLVQEANGRKEWCQASVTSIGL